MSKSFFGRGALTLVITGIVAFGSTASGCGGEMKFPGSSRNETVTLTLINSKPEIQDSLTSMARDYQRETGVVIEVQMTKGTVLEESLTGTLANEPTDILMLQSWEMDLLTTQTAVDLTDQPWVEHVVSASGEEEERIFGFPICIEGKGLIFNRTAAETVLERPYNPASCLDARNLKVLLEDLRKSGMEYPVIISSTDWLLGDAMLGMVYETQDYTGDGIKAIQDGLKYGAEGVDLLSNPKFHGFLDTLELLAEYSNYRGKSSGYAEDAKNFAEGKSALWFNGNWVWPTLVDNGGKDSLYTILPFFLGEETDAPSNCSIPVSPSRYLAVSATCDLDKRQAAKDFFNWLAFSDKGQDALVNKLSLVPAFSNNTLAPSNPLNRSVKDYLDSGRVFPRSETPTELYKDLSEHLGEFISGKSSREELAREIQEDWKDEVD